MQKNFNINFHQLVLNLFIKKYLMCITKLIIIGFTLLYIARTINFFNLQFVPKGSQAKCMDGSPYGYYIYQPDPMDVKPTNKLLIYFQQTDFGWCVKEDLSTSLQECHKFTIEDNLIDFGSSNNWGNSITFLSGILSPFADDGFNSWYKVYVPSCDGGSFFGKRDIKYKQSHLYFHGSYNVQEMFAHLQKIGYLNKDQIVIGGSFNAAIASLHWYNHLQTLTNKPIRILTDSMSYLNYTNFQHQRPVIQNIMQMVDKVFLDGIKLPNTACVNAYPNQQWKCMFIEWLYPYLNKSISTLFFQSTYDGWEIDEVLGFKCTWETGSLSQCTKEHQQIIQTYHKNVTEVVKKVLAYSEKWSGFAISCVAHKFLGFRLTDQEFSVPMKSNHFPQTILNDWLKNNTKKIYMDEVDWPDNVPCSRKAKTLSKSSKVQVISRKQLRTK